ncbi:hypothetical protein HDV00_000044 [Rhizophlyctis rosea]|nr:hypothetical protein HDV00_000044 [Rhizophlyctis rosea]
MSSRLLTIVLRAWRLCCNLIIIRYWIKPIFYLLIYRSYYVGVTEVVYEIVGECLWDNAALVVFYVITYLEAIATALFCVVRNVPIPTNAILVEEKVPITHILAIHTEEFNIRQSERSSHWTIGFHLTYIKSTDGDEPFIWFTVPTSKHEFTLTATPWTTVPKFDILAIESERWVSRQGQAIFCRYKWTSPITGARFRRTFSFFAVEDGVSEDSPLELLGQEVTPIEVITNSEGGHSPSGRNNITLTVKHTKKEKSPRQNRRSKSSHPTSSPPPSLATITDNLITLHLPTTPIRYTQPFIAPSFSDGKSIHATLQALKAKTIKPSDIPPMEVAEYR